MKASLKTTFFLLLSPLVAISLILLLTTVTPFLKIPDKVRHIQMDIDEMIQGERFSRYFNMQVRELVEANLSERKEKGKDRFFAAQRKAQEALSQLKHLNSGQEYEGDEERERERRHVAKLGKGFEEINLLVQSAMRLENEGRTEEAAAVIGQQIEPVFDHVMTQEVEKYSAEGEVDLQKDLSILQSRHFTGMQNGLKDLGLDVFMVIQGARFTRCVTQQFREYADSLLFHSEVQTWQIKLAQEKAQEALAAWRELVSAQESENGNRERELTDLDRLGEQYSRICQDGDKILGSLKAGKMDQAQGLILDDAAMDPLLQNVDAILGREEQELRQDFDRVEKTAHQVILAMGVLSLSIFLVGIGAPWILSRRIINPILELKNAALEVAAGKLDTHVSPGSNNEIGDLAAAFNVMTRDLSQSRDALVDSLTERQQIEELLRQSQAGLELRIRERTAELVMANESLQTEILERERAQEDRSALEIQLRQSQKAEAIGLLAGGVAHDYNNTLMAIAAYCDLLSMKLTPDHPGYRDVLAISRAAEQGASVTRQLLAYSRKQILAPRILDLNHVLSEMDTMLPHLLGEHIELQVHSGPGLGRIKADPGQIQQVIMNLAINSLDAMPKGGTLTIETSNVTLGEDYVARHVQVQPGPYVLLAVSDTGHGMDESTRDRIFEPFFTTKEQGKGTGLGLSAVYGVVKQSDGFIWVYSEVGVGTTFKIYFPRVDDFSDSEAKEEVATPAADGHETILLVDDNEAIRKSVGLFFEMHGYTVLQARDGQEALRMVGAYDDPISLLITDVVMPGMGGGELAQRLADNYPRMKFLYMSGYTEEAVIRQGTLPPGSTFLSKPVSMKDILHTARELLRSAERPAT